MKKPIVAFVCLILCLTVSLTLVFSQSFETYGTVNTEISRETAPVIIIDPGHGGFDGGTTTKDGIPEKDINLNISLKLKDYLKSFGYKVIMTREADVSLEDDGLSTIKAKKTSDIHNRFKLMEETDSCIFVSIHQNHYSVEKYNGAQVFYSPQTEETSSLLAECIQSSIVSNVQPDNTRLIKKCDNSVYLIYNAKKTAVLVECGFLSNEKEAQNLLDTDYQKKIAYSVALGIKDYYSKSKEE